MIDMKLLNELKHIRFILDLDVSKGKQILTNLINKCDNEINDFLGEFKQK